MNWLPVPADFRASLKDALEIENPEERLKKLAALTEFQLDFVETIQLDNALNKTLAQSEREYRSVRLAVLSSCTIDHLLPAIRIAALRRQLNIEIYAGAYGQYRQEILDPSSPLHTFEPDMILLSLTGRDVIGEVPVGVSQDGMEQAVSTTVTELVSLWRHAKKQFNATVIQQSFLEVTEPLFGSHDRLIPGAPNQILSRLNEQMATAVSKEGALLLDVARASSRVGLDAWFDIRRWLQSKIEIAPQSAPKYGDLVARLIAAKLGQSRKCLVFDLDNTLWGGVIGDDGFEGIVMGEGSAVGEAHLALQRYAKLLKERGVILAVCSKNELEIAEDVFEYHPEMFLKRSDFAAFVANWGDKAENIRSIAAQLNIGLDSLVFVDDNPVERARIRESLPIVAVPELPADVADYVRCIADAGYFEAVDFTTEDQMRADQYVTNIKREAVRDAAQSMDDFLRGLEMSVKFGPITSVDLPRVTQLFNKTNQFNTTTRRYTQDDVSRFAAEKNNITLQFRLADRFGDNGLVSVIILCSVPEEEDTLEIVNWVMSCRVFGRQLEDEVMNIAVEAALIRGVKALHADFIPTKKNNVISGLYERLGFSKIDNPTQGDMNTRWLLSLSDYTKRPTFLKREAQIA